LIARAPQVLPLSGNPNLVVLGTEVPLGSGYADIVAVEKSGRPVVIEVKLAKNPESRRAVIAQILAYASSIYRTSVDEFTAALGASLAKAGRSSVVEAVQAADQDGSVDPVALADALRSNIASGDIRLVLVLDSAPPELVGVVGYLGAIAPNLTLDLVTVTAFEVGGQSVIVPQRIEPGRFEQPATPGRSAATAAGAGTTYSPGSGEFAASIENAPIEQQAELRRYQVWAEALADAGLATLRTGRGQGRWTLVPVVKGGDAGLVTIWNDRLPAISPWRSALLKWAPSTLAKLESHVPPIVIAQGNSLRSVGEDILGLLTAAYEEATSSGLTLPELSTQTPAILIKLSDWVAELPHPGSAGIGANALASRAGYGYRADMTAEELYQSARAWWVLDPKRAEGFRYAVAIHRGVTLGVWEITPGTWRSSTPKPGESVRWSFEGAAAPPEVVEEFVGPTGKRVPRFREDGRNVFGQANPIGYWP
ncbi:MAG: hypothetical protein ACLQBX_13230, partial [Candidatus Limnocylindrales bacterium]